VTSGSVPALGRRTSLPAAAEFAPGAPVASPRAGGRSGAKGSGRHRKVANRVFKWVRRVHLYSGLALVPFVCLYGISGYLFNHPDRGGPAEAVPASVVAAAGLAGLPDAADVAERLVARLRGRDPGLQVVGPAPAYAGAFTFTG